MNQFYMDCFVLGLTLGTIVLYVSETRRWKRLSDAAFQLGYMEMKRLLAQPYSGQDGGEYDSHLVLSSYIRLKKKYLGTKSQTQAYERGVVQAVTEYEREFGAP